ncbi:MULTISPECIES: hypothetical protein [Myroides]|uniref:Lipoprotein n=1 Tax=Myroides albus TaxID=2562892 RepID=A0A6I3LKX2_9FLAO|nr:MULTISPECIES: hypothetical protein [Myroides]MTG96675.1 hypothetical protein [Myroides albus]MVX34687.1 hypothetical protein [Myroides sp. LoEW2-1]UVD80913.1 hypothetical protein NWE55_06620 [Myroides albus]
MKIKSLLTVFTLVTLFTLTACNNKDISSSRAFDTIGAYLNEKPEFESTTLTLGKKKLRMRKDSLQIEQYKTLEKGGYLEFEDENSKKKWLSKDSIWNVTIKLAEKAHPYVIDQKNDKVTVKTILYTLGDSSNLQLNNNSKKSATASVMLNKEYTPFIALAKDKNPNTKFITKKFKLRYSETTGWSVN